MIHLSDVEPGDYEVCETNAPAGYILDDHCQTLTVAVNGSAEFGPWVNGLGQISWQKVDAQSGDKICCASFTLVGDGGAADGFSLNVTDNGQNDEDPDAGELLVTGLLLGHYTITEVTPPAGYDLANPHPWASRSTARPPRRKAPSRMRRGAIPASRRRPSSTRSWPGMTPASTSSSPPVAWRFGERGAVG